MAISFAGTLAAHHIAVLHAVSTLQRVVKDQWVHRVSRAHGVLYINIDGKMAVKHFNQPYIITVQYFEQFLNFSF